MRKKDMKDMGIQSYVEIITIKTFIIVKLNQQEED
jgi:hypothetical protein